MLHGAYFEVLKVRGFTLVICLPLIFPYNHVYILPSIFSETLGVLERTLERIETDLQIKTNSVQLDEQCMEVRQKLSEHPKLL